MDVLTMSPYFIVLACPSLLFALLASTVVSRLAFAASIKLSARSRLNFFRCFNMVKLLVGKSEVAPPAQWICSSAAEQLQHRTIDDRQNPVGIQAGDYGQDDDWGDGCHFAQSDFQSIALPL